MSRLTKTQREKVRQMFGGRCAYCGVELGEKWHADHVEPVRRKCDIVQTPKGYRFTSGPMTRPHFDVFENFMPACAPCNIDKHAMSIENWRGKLERTLDVLARNYPTYRHALRFGLLTEQNQPIVFYFERQARITTEDGK